MVRHDDVRSREIEIRLLLPYEEGIGTARMSQRAAREMGPRPTDSVSVVLCGRSQTRTLHCGDVPLHRGRVRDVSLPAESRASLRRCTKLMDDSVPIRGPGAREGAAVFIFRGPEWPLVEY